MEFSELPIIASLLGKKSNKSQEIPTSTQPITPSQPKTTNQLTPEEELQLLNNSDIRQYINGEAYPKYPTAPQQQPRANEPVPEEKSTSS